MTRYHSKEVRDLREKVPDGREHRDLDLGEDQDRAAAAVGGHGV